jgi:hypothetical protein
LIILIAAGCAAVSFLKTAEKSKVKEKKLLPCFLSQPTQKFLEDFCITTIAKIKTVSTMGPVQKWLLCLLSLQCSRQGKFGQFAPHCGPPASLIKPFSLTLLYGPTKNENSYQLVVPRSRRYERPFIQKMKIRTSS